MPVEFRTSVVTVDGKVASQTPSSSYPGGGNQTFIDYPAGVPRSDIIKPAGPATLLPEVTPTTSTTTATPMSLANTTPPLAPTVPYSFAPPLPQASTAIEQLKLLPTFAGKTTSQIESELITQGFKSTPANNGGSVWTKDLPDGNTAAIRLDPPTIRSPSKGFADEVPHAHKEIVPTNAVTNGNYSPGKTVTTLDDNCCSTTNPRDTHIPIK
jgi:hypothetical protein